MPCYNYFNDENYEELAKKIMEKARYQIKSKPYGPKLSRGLVGFFKWRSYYYASISLNAEFNIIGLPSSPNPYPSSEKEAFERFKKRLAAAVKKQKGVLDASIFYSASANGRCGGAYLISVYISPDAL